MPERPDVRGRSHQSDRVEWKDGTGTRLIVVTAWTTADTANRSSPAYADAWRVLQETGVAADGEPAATRPSITAGSPGASGWPHCNFRWTCRMTAGAPSRPTSRIPMRRTTTGAPTGAKGVPVSALQRRSGPAGRRPRLTRRSLVQFVSPSTTSGKTTTLAAAARTASAWALRSPPRHRRSAPRLRTRDARQPDTAA